MIVKKKFKNVGIVMLVLTVVSMQALFAETPNLRKSGMDNIVSTCPPIKEGFVDESGDFVDFGTFKKLGNEKNGRAVIVTPGTENFAIEARSRLISPEAAINANTDEKLVKLLRAGWFDSENPEIKIVNGTVKMFSKESDFKSGKIGCYQLVYYPDIESVLPGNEYAYLGVPVNVVIHPNDGWSGNGASAMKADEEVIMTSKEAIEYGATDRMQGLLGPIETLVDESGFDVTGAIVDGTGPLGVDLWVYDEFNTNTWYHGNPQISGGEDLLSEVSFINSVTDENLNYDSEDDFKLGKSGTYFVKSDWLGSSSAITTVKVHDDQAKINASDTIIKSDQAQTITNEGQFIDLMNASGEYATLPYTPKVIIKNDDFTNIKAGIAGIYDVTFTIDVDGNPLSTNDNATKTAKLTVLSGSITPDGKGYVNAQDTIIKNSVATGILNKNELVQVMNATGAYGAIKIVPTVTLTDEALAAIQAGTIGFYEVEFSIDADNNISTTNDNAQITKTLSVIGGSVTPDDKGFVIAEDTFIMDTEAKKIAVKDELVQVMKAKGAYGVNEITPTVTLADQALVAIQAGKAGIYEVTFSIDADNNSETLEDNASITVKLMVLSGSVTPDGKGYVNAFDTVIKKDKAQTIASKDELVQVMNATGGYDFNEIVPTVTLTDEALVAIQAGTIGFYEVTFSIDADNNVSTTNDNAQITKTLSVIGGSVTPDDKGFVIAEDTFIMDTEAKKIAVKDELVQVMKAKGAYGVNEITPTVTLADQALSDIKSGKSGIYEVAFSIDADNNPETLEDNAAITVKLMVLSGSVTPDGKGFVDASNKILNKKEALKIKEKSDLTKILDAKGAYGTSEIIPTLSVSDADFANIKLGRTGSYAITFSIDGDNNPSTINDNAEITVTLAIKHGAINPD